MVATKLSEVASKGYGWVYGSTPETAATTERIRTNSISQPPDQTNNAIANNGTSSSSSYLWDAASSSLSTASNSLSNAADSAYSTLAGVANYAWESTGRTSSESSTAAATPTSSTLSIEAMDHPSSWLQTMVDRNHFGSPLKLHNPYNRVRGRYYAQNQSSLSAVRSLLPLITEHDEMDPLVAADMEENQIGRERLLTGESESLRSTGSSSKAPRRSSNPYTPDPPEHMSTPSTAPASQMHKNSETASQLAEGTVRALRDIALDEAVELYSALRFWSERWDRPLLSFLEAGPPVWFSQDGYDHQLVGQKVAQIQAVLARRCVVIGELQQHLLRAGWQRGVAQWGVLGQGGQWATVQGTYVMTEETAELSHRTSTIVNDNNHEPRRLSAASVRGLPAQPLERIGMDHPQRPASSKSLSKNRSKWKREKGYYASVFVRNECDGKILMDDAALAEWSVDAMALIRDLLVRASDGKVTLPYEHNWKATNKTLPARQPSFHSEAAESDQAMADPGELIVEQAPPNNNNNNDGGAQEGLDARQLPSWAQWGSKAALGNSYEFEPKATVGDDDHDSVVITNLPLMAAEVSQLLDAIEDIMPLQKSRRMRKLRPPSMFRRRWYLTVVAAPGLAYLTRHLFSKGEWTKVLRVTLAKIHQFFDERVVVPFVAIIEEIWKGREDISDKKARIEVIAALKEMIRSWLDENHPEIPAAERNNMAELMDISLIERQKTESLKTLFELNQAIRLTFIEMQFIKKEMVNALYTMDDMMTKNEINTNLAAVTPAVLLAYTTKQVFKFFYYALLKLGKSKEETYSSFRQILTDIERLLVMRDNPPSSPFPQHNARHLSGDTEDASQSQYNAERSSRCDVLSADDLGMLMLHIHECRTILWRDHNRFSSGIIQSVSEDLAELAGERGAVSVQQQLQIIARMCRTYPFLKVISIGTTFHERFIGSAS